jgi:hypothetical protein
MVDLAAGMMWRASALPLVEDPLRVRRLPPPERRRRPRAQTSCGSPPTNSFSFQLHDFSPRSTTILNPALHAHDHGDYWSRQDQVDYYVNLVR